MSLTDALLNDLSDTSDLELEGLDDQESSNFESNSLSAQPHTVRYTINDLLTLSDLGTVQSIKEMCPLLNKAILLDKRLDELHEDVGENNRLSANEQDLLSQANGMISKIFSNFSVLNAFVKGKYESVWPDLYSIVKNPLAYIRLIMGVKFDIKSFKEKVTSGDLDFLTKDQIMSLTMSNNFLIRMGQSKIPDTHIQRLILEACDIQLQINQIQQKFRSFVTDRAQKISPNLAALVGSTVAAQLLSVTSLETLSCTPACNLSSLGKSSISSEGFIYNSDIVKSVPEDFRKQALRQVCAKVVLVSRIDLNASRTNTLDDSIGTRWKQEIQERLEKMMLPPENVRVKPLPVPINQKSKKRGGRKFRKMRERMKMSEVEKAQNKIAFGQQEVTRTDAFGEEIGLGMLGKESVRDIGIVRGVQLSKGTREKLTAFAKGEEQPSGNDSRLAKLL